MLHWRTLSSFSFSSLDFPLLHSQNLNHLLQQFLFPFEIFSEDFHLRSRICYSCVWSVSFWQLSHPRFHRLHLHFLPFSYAFLDFFLVSSSLSESEVSAFFFLDLLDLESPLLLFFFGVSSSDSEVSSRRLDSFLERFSSLAPSSALRLAAASTS